MLNAAAMKDLLSENTDEHASHFAFFSRAGTILGHDHAADVKSIKRFAAFAANTWSHNVVSVATTGRTVPPLTPGTCILQALVRHDDDDGGGGGRRLHGLVVRVNELVGAVTHVREGTLLAALKGREEFGGEEGEEGEGRPPSKMQILVWRSEGMGQYMAEELGPGFKIPKGFH